MKTNRKPRNGISLIEVIACTVIVAAMMVPIAGVMRASSQAIAVAENQSVGQDLADVGRWLKNSVEDGAITNVRRNVLSIRNSGGVDGNILVRGGDLIFDDGANPSILLEGVRRIEFQELRQTGGALHVIGLQIQMQKTDAKTGRNVISDTVIALPTQA